MKHTIDATNRKVGRIASEAAKFLMGKDKATFVRNVAPQVQVHVTNASKAALDEKKMKDKRINRFSGYPSGLKSESMRHFIGRKGAGAIVRKAVKGMLPKNKLQAKMLKNLTVSE